jgi:hypothetical protein
MLLFVVFAMPANGFQLPVMRIYLHKTVLTDKLY